MQKDDVYAGLFGLCAGDALGVPVEFRQRENLSRKPVADMTGGGTHRQIPGTWSDDSSLAFCLAESLCAGYDLEDLAMRFVRWLEEGYWTAHGTVFDVGNRTADSIHQLKWGVPPVRAGGADERSNGNGSLMRILPLVFYCSGMPFKTRSRMVYEVSSLTHRHIRAVIGCILYVEIGCRILRGVPLPKAVKEASKETTGLFHGERELSRYRRIMDGELHRLTVQEIESGGYVVHTLEAALWCLLTTASYREAVLKAVNLGGDTDTTAAVTGGLAGILHGYSKIPRKWINALAGKDDIEDLCDRFYRACLSGRD